MSALHDPFARTAPAAEWLVHVVTKAALAWTAVYLAWRVGFGLGGTEVPAGPLLLAAELLGGMVFAARARAAFASPVALAHAPDAPIPDTLAVVDATGASVAELRTTLVSLRRVEGVVGIVVTGADGERWGRTVAERFGAQVLDADVSIADVVRGGGTGWVLLLRAGDLPMPDLVTACAPCCSAPDVAVVQMGVEETDPTTFEHDADPRWTLRPFEQQVVRPSLAARGSVPWYGDGPVMLRRAALATVPREVTEHRRVGAALIADGFAVTYLPLVLARVVASRSADERLARRAAHRRAGWADVGPGRLRGLEGSARFAHALGVLPLLVGLQRALLVAAGLAVLGWGQVPWAGGVAPFAALAVPSYTLRWIAHLLLGRGRLRPLSILRDDLRCWSVDVASLRGPGRLQLRSTAVLAASIVVVHVGVAVAALAVWHDWPRRPPAEVLAVTLALVALFVGVAMELVLEPLVERQRRGVRRVRLGLVSCRVEEHEGRLIDLSASGAGVIVPGEVADVPAEGETTTLAFRIPDADGAWRNVSALVTVVHRSRHGDGEARLGLAFDDPSDAPLDPVVEFLTVDRRLESLGRRFLPSAS